MLRLISCFLLLSISTNIFGLTNTQLKNIAKGEIIQSELMYENAPWPEYTFYSYLNVPPKLAMALFSHYPDQIKFSKGLIRADIIELLPNNDTHVEYEMKMPWPLSNEIYVTGNIVSREKDGSFILRWYLVKSNQCENTFGKIILSPYKNGSLFTYKSFIKPKTVLAPLLAPFVKGDILDSYLSIKQYLEETSKSSTIESQKFIQEFYLRFPEEMSEK